MDYSVCNGLNFNSHGLAAGLLVYDVNCQYLVHFEDRLKDVLDYLWQDPDMKL